MRNFIYKRTRIRLVTETNVGDLLEIEHLRRFFRHFAVDCVFDVGANKGQYATLLRERVGYEGLIFSFEPIPELARYLKERASNDGKWFIRECALDRKAGVAELNVTSSSNFSSLLEPQAEEFASFRREMQIERKQPVTVSTLKDEILSIKSQYIFSRPFLKLDTQGNELSVIAGAGSSLSEFIGLQVELSFKKMYEGSNNYVETIDFLKDNGFSISALIHNHPWTFPALAEADCIFYRTDHPTLGAGPESS
jgi:FkbM family methyltransferase